VNRSSSLSNAVLAALLLCAGLLAAGACDADGDDRDALAADAAEEDSRDAAADDSADAAAPDPADDSAGDEDPNDDEPDSPEGFGEIHGQVFNNTATTEGTLTIALMEELPPVGEPAFSIVDASPDFPAHSFAFVDVPVGPGYYVVALLDVGDPNDLGSRGPGPLRSDRGQGRDRLRRLRGREHQRKIH